MEGEWQQKWERMGGEEEEKGWSKHWLWMNAIFFFSPSPHLPPVLLLLWATEQEALHHPDRQRKRREGERKRDCDGGIKGYPSLSVTSFIVPCSVLPAHPSSAVTCTHTKIGTHFPPIFTHSTTTTNAQKHQRHTNFNCLPGPMLHKHKIICSDSHRKVVKHENRKAVKIKSQRNVRYKSKICCLEAPALTFMHARAAHKRIHTHYIYPLALLVSTWVSPDVGSALVFPGPSKEMASAGSRARLETTDLQPSTVWVWYSIIFASFDNWNHS